MPFKEMTFNALCKNLGINKELGIGLIATSDDQVDFCAKISKIYGLELTLQDAVVIFETSPLKE